MVALPGLHGMKEKFFRETRRRGMETQVKPTKALGIIAQFMNSEEKRWKRCGVIPQGPSILAGENMMFR